MRWRGHRDSGVCLSQMNVEEGKMRSYVNVVAEGFPRRRREGKNTMLPLRYRDAGVPGQ